MALQYYNRYGMFLENGVQNVVPYVQLPLKPSDKKYIFRYGQSRLDKISQQYYGTPFFGWLILQANPGYTGLEANIPDGAVLTIPFPLLTSLQDYKGALDNYFLYYGK
jgi:phage tail protein X